MFNKLMRLVMFLLLLMQMACTTLVGHLAAELHGVVIDKSTSQPIEGAIVVAQWQGVGLHLVDSRTVCFHVESATTDEGGRYNIAAIPAAPAGVMSESALVAGVYKEGYREVTYKDTQEPGFVRAPRGIVHLVPFTGSREERFEYLRRQRVGCSGAGESERNLFEFSKSVHEEMKRLAVTKEEREYVSFHERVVAGRAIATDADMTSIEYEKLIDKYLKENPL